MNSTMPTTDGNYPDSHSIAKASPQDPTEKLFQEDIRNEATQQTGHKQNYSNVCKNVLNLETQNKSILDKESQIKPKMALTSSKKKQFNQSQLFKSLYLKSNLLLGTTLLSQKLTRSTKFSSI